LFSLKQNEAERPSRNAAQHRMNPTGPIGPSSIGAFAFVVGLVLKGDLHGPARRVMHSVGVRHEVVQVAVETAVSSRTHGDTAVHNPVVCNRYPTRTCVAGNGGVRSSGNKCILHPDRDGNGPARGCCDCQHQGSRGLGLRSMVNTCEPLINVVRCDKPKVLTCPKRA
jgi:hypothetical protein